jgi:hypothetical protein
LVLLHNVYAKKRKNMKLQHKTEADLDAKLDLIIDGAIEIINLTNAIPVPKYLTKKEIERILNDKKSKNNK